MRGAAARRVEPATDRRVTYIAIVLAVAVHVAILAWASRWADPRRIGNPPAVERTGSTAAAGGMAATNRRLEHSLRVVDGENDTPVEGARVTDALAANSVFTDQFGRATLRTRPAAILIVQVEKPGFAMVALRVANTDTTPTLTTVPLAHADVPYAAVDTIFQSKCIYCHGATGRAAGVDLMSYRTLMAGRAGNALVRAHDPDSSRLVRVLTDATGPDGKPSLHLLRTPRLGFFEMSVIIEWIREGARDARP